MKRLVCNKDCMSEEASSLVETAIQLANDEFDCEAKLFTPIVVRMDMLKVDEFNATKSPGVYVFLHEELGFLKVGKSLSNASKRALEHCRDNTSSKDGSIHMGDFRDCAKAYMLVFALPSQESLHWVLALEYFLEKELKPRIKSIRNG